MKKIQCILLCTVSMLLLASCQGVSDGRMLKKFISRFNAEEYAAASTYVYPADRMNVAFFAEEVKCLAPNTFIKLEDYKTVESATGRFIEAKIKWENATPALRNYFSEIGLPIDSEGLQEVKLNVRDTNDGETLSFVWGIPHVSSEDLNIASVVKNDGKPVEVTYLRTEPNTNSTKLGTMEKDLIVGPVDDNGFMPAYTVDKNGCIAVRYIKESPGIKLDKSAFFSLGIFGSMSLIVALIIIIVIIVPIYYIGAVSSAIFSSIPMAAPVIIIALILGVIYVIWQLLEKILFELFIINLPG